MRTISELRDMTLKLASRVQIPKIDGIVFPSLSEVGQERGCEFMAVALESGAGGVSYVSIPDGCAAEYRDLKPQAFIGKRPEQFVEAFSGTDPLRNMLGLASVNAICQHVMRLCNCAPGEAADSVGLMNVKAGDRVGMVGFFPPLLKYMRNMNASLIIVEKNELLIERYPNLHITHNVTELNNCNKVLCTSATLLNDTIDEVLEQCSAAEHISVLGPTAGYFPDPLFARGVDVLGGRLVSDGRLLLQLIAQRKRWGAATQKLCFQASDYKGLDKLCSSIFSCS